MDFTSSSESSGSYSHLREDRKRSDLPDKCHCNCDYCQEARHYRPHYCGREMWECTDRPGIEWYDDEDGELAKLCKLDKKADALLGAAIATTVAIPKGEPSKHPSANAETRPLLCDCHCRNCKDHGCELPHECNHDHRVVLPSQEKTFRPWKWTVMKRQIRFLERSAKNLREGLGELRRKRKH